MKIKISVARVTHRLAVAMTAAAVQSVAIAAAIADDSIPRWDINELCAASTLGARCARIESENRRAVFNRWEAQPVADRQACFAVVNAPGQRSYKRLLTCLEERGLKAIEATPVNALPDTLGNTG